MAALFLELTRRLQLQPSTATVRRYRDERIVRGIRGQPSSEAAVDQATPDYALVVKTALDLFDANARHAVQVNLHLMFPQFCGERARSERSSYRTSCLSVRSLSRHCSAQQICLLFNAPIKDTRVLGNIRRCESLHAHAYQSGMRHRP